MNTTTTMERTRRQAGQLAGRWTKTPQGFRVLALTGNNPSVAGRDVAVQVVRKDGSYQVVEGRASRPFRVKFGDWAGQQAVFVTRPQDAPERQSRSRSNGNSSGPDLSVGPWFCGNLSYRTRGEHEQSCNNPNCSGGSR